MRSLLWAVVWSGYASQPCAADGAACDPPLTRVNLVRCVLAASPLIVRERHALEAARARKLAVSPLLPSNPTLSVTAGRRTRDPDARSFNWSANLAQEFELAGQRGLRRESAQADVDAQGERLQLARRELASDAWLAFFEALSAQAQQLLAASMNDAAQAVAAAARARAGSGLIAPIDSDLAEAAALRVWQAQLAAARRAAAADATLAALLGRDLGPAGLAISGELAPLAGVEQLVTQRRAKDVSEQPELRALRAGQRALELRADSYRRTRIPNLTLSVFALDEGFTERVLGAGLSFPIPLPGELGRRYVGEIAEAEALAQESSSEQRRVARAYRLALAIAADAYASRAREVAAFTPERVTRAQQSLQALSREVESGRLGVRDAVVAQQALIELLQADVIARTAWCVASVELARAAGVPLESWTP